jgi:DNA-binding NarL/FixJ family response regulator
VPLQVASLVREGCTNAEIGERIFVSTRTVQAHLTRIYTKLAITSRTELAAEAARRDDD